MYLITGGAYQGKSNYAVSVFNFDKNSIADGKTVDFEETLILADIGAAAADSIIEEIFFDVCLCRIRHLLVLGSIATRGGSHIPHHGSIYHPIGSAQVVPVADGIF